jgi:pimeloyl-ACP methyl ester carboxylesterase
MLVPEDVVGNGHRVAYGDHGPADGAPVTLIHGTPSSSVIWRNVVPSLVADGHRVVVLDLLGYGASERPADPQVDTSVSAQVDVVLAVLTAQGVESAHIVAHDIGGGVAQRLGVLHPGRMRSLVLIDSVSFDSWPSERTRRQMQAGLDALIAAPADAHRAHVREWLLSTVVDDAELADGALDHYLDIITGPVGQASFYQHQVAHYDPRHTDELTDRIAELGRVPVHLIWGERDGWQRLSWAERLRDAIPGATLHVVADAGHFVLEEAPDAVVHQLRRFLSMRTI